MKETERDTKCVCIVCVCVSVCVERDALRDEAETAAIYIPFCSYREQPPSSWSRQNRSPNFHI